MPIGQIEKFFKEAVLHMSEWETGDCFLYQNGLYFSPAGNSYALEIFKLEEVKEFDEHLDSLVVELKSGEKIHLTKEHGPEM